MPHARLPPPQRLRDLRNRAPCRHKCLEILASELALGCNLLAVDGPQAMLSHPIRDRRFVSADPPTDLGQRQALAEEQLERCAIHTSIILTAWDEARTCVRPLRTPFTPARRPRLGGSAPARAHPYASPLFSSTRAYARSNCSL